MTCPQIDLARRIVLLGLIALASVPGRVSGESAPSPYSGAINALADRLAARFVDPAIGKKYAEMLRANLAAGRYNAITDATALAGQLTQDLQATARDGHLRVAPESEIPALGGPGIRRQGPPPGPRPVDMPSVAETKWIADGIAYIRFNQFAGEPESVAAVEKFMHDFASARAIVIDTRTLTRGGGLAEMDIIFSYLFDRETVLVDMEVAKSNQPGGGPPTGRGSTLREVAAAPNQLRLEHVALPHPTEHRLSGAKVFFLTSLKTRSAGEHFALALKRTHRGTLIGERTAGANHFGGFEPIGEGLVAFIPVGRTFDPDTGKDWEGSGVLPDVEVPPDQALDKALEMAGR